jgi:methyl-accepting chemotaxis protein
MNNIFSDLQKATSDAYAAIEPVIDGALQSIEQAFTDATASDGASRAATNRHMEISIVAIIVIVLTFGFLTGRSVSRPLAAMTRAMGELADGNFGVVLPGLARKDEIGEMARAVEGFKTKATENAHAKAQEQQARERAAAAQKKAAEEREMAERAAAMERDELARSEAMHSLADSFQATVGAIIDHVAAAATELKAAATSLSKTAETTQHQSAVVASASEQTSANVQSVASATDEMSSSIREIARQVQESSKIAGEAVRQAEETNGRINRLSGAAARIGDVVKLITSVAEQTNLLALNATIEAARAGEAGKGFAVVAHEVKALAAQTSKATDEISSQVAGMQHATQESVFSIKEIGGTIGQISEISSTITLAVEQQGAATRDIARNAGEAAKGTSMVAANIVDVNRGASETGAASSKVLTSAHALANESERLKTEVAKFFTTVRTGLANRRRADDPNYTGPERRADRAEKRPSMSRAS